MSDPTAEASSSSTSPSSSTDPAPAPAPTATAAAPALEPAKVEALKAYRSKIKDHEQMGENLKNVRLNIKASQDAYDQSEEDLKAIQSVGQIIAEVLKQLDEERCECGEGRLRFDVLKRFDGGLWEKVLSVPCR